MEMSAGFKGYAGCIQGAQRLYIPITETTIMFNHSKKQQL